MIKGIGHKSEYVARDLVTSANEKLAGRDIDLSSVARQVERQIIDKAKKEKGPIWNRPHSGNYDAGKIATSRILLSSFSTVPILVAAPVSRFTV